MPPALSSPYQSPVARCCSCGAEPKFWRSPPIKPPSVVSPKKQTSPRTRRLVDVRDAKQAFDELLLPIDNNGADAIWQCVKEIRRLRAELRSMRRSVRESELLKVVEALQARLARQKAATVLQRGWRAYVHALREGSATRLQAAQRGRRARAELARMQEERAAHEYSAVSSLQALQRGRVVRVNVRQRGEAATRLQAWRRSQLGRRRAALSRDERAATRRIQRVARGHYGRKVAAAQRRLLVDSSAVTIQASARGMRMRAQLRQEREAARQIQRAARGHRGRKLAAEQRREVEKSAVRIQALWRGRLARSDAESKPEFFVSGSGCADANGEYWLCEALADGVPQYERIDDVSDEGTRYVVQRISQSSGETLWVLLRVCGDGTYSALYANSASSSSAHNFDLPPASGWDLAQDGSSPPPSLRWHWHDARIQLVGGGVQSCNGIYSRLGSNDGVAQWEMVVSDKVFVIQRISRAAEKLWVVASIRLSQSASTKVFYACVSGADSPPIGGGADWVLGQDGVEPVPTMLLADEHH